MSAVGEAIMEFWGLGLLLALWRYFTGIDWDLRLTRRRDRTTRKKI
jgi:hypothetical protein